MKTFHKAIASIAAAITLIASAATSQAVNRTLIVLGENESGKIPFTNIGLFDPMRAVVDAIYNTVVPNGEIVKFHALANGHYQRFVTLSNSDGTRANLLDQLIQQSKDGYTVDLAILGGVGSSESLLLHSGEHLTGRTVRTVTLPGGGTFQFVVTGTLRSLLTDARAQEGAAFNFKLRLVCMSNDFGSTLNDDWLAIGARASVGVTRRNFMPEPMITSFWDGFVKNDKRVAQAAADSFSDAGVVYAIAGLGEFSSPSYATPDPVTGLDKFQESNPIVAGNGNLIFKDEFQLALNQSKTFTVQANRIHNFVQVYLVAGQTCRFTSTGVWTNPGSFPFATSHTTDADGYLRGPFDPVPRLPAANMMRLIGERFRHTNDALSSIGGSGISIGSSLTATAGGHGFLSLSANDNINDYADNSGHVTVTIRRIQ